MWDALQAYLERGGRLMYMGGNGLYWRDRLPRRRCRGVIEVRRAEDGIRAWDAEPGEYYHSFTGEYGGLWRRQGRAAAAAGRRRLHRAGLRRLAPTTAAQPGSFDPRAAFIFEGIGPTRSIGDFGLVGGGAAGLELDRADAALGTPPHALVLATSRGHTDLLMLVNEEFGVVPAIGRHREPARARRHGLLRDAERRRGVLAGSIAWCGSLSHERLRQQRLAAHRERAAPLPRPEAVRVRALLAATLALAALLAAREVRADAAENDLYDLLMAQQSVSICHFAMSDDAAAKLEDTVVAYQKELDKSDADIDQLSEQASWQILRQRPKMCAPDGSWKRRYDQIVGDLGARSSSRRSRPRARVPR